MPSLIDGLNAAPTTFSFEFFPPKTAEAIEKQDRVFSELFALKPAYVSVTYGAGGSTRDATLATISRLTAYQVPIIAHLTGVLASESDLIGILSAFSDLGVAGIMALRGDAPKGRLYDRSQDPFQYAIDLVRLIKQRFPNFVVGAAAFPEGHPETPNRLKDLDYLKAKVDAGVDYLCTQLFFDNRDYFDFLEQCDYLGIRVPIVAGIMPVTSKSGLIRSSELALGARIPAALHKAVMDAADEDEVRKIGYEWALDQVKELVAKEAAGIHFYTLNMTEPTRRILSQF